MKTSIYLFLVCLALSSSSAFAVQSSATCGNEDLTVSVTFAQDLLSGVYKKHGAPDVALTRVQETATLETVTLQGKRNPGAAISDDINVVVHLDASDRPSQARVYLRNVGVDEGLPLEGPLPCL